MQEEHWRLRLIELLSALAVTQAEFARVTGVDATAVSGLLLPPEKKGRRNLGLRTMGKICTAYGLSEDWFLLPLGSKLPGQATSPRAQLTRLIEALPEEHLDTVARVVCAIAQAPPIAMPTAGTAIPIAAHFKPPSYDEHTAGVIKIMQTLDPARRAKAHATLKAAFVQDAEGFPPPKAQRQNLPVPEREHAAA